ncbi:unnamed protein product [Owenia fusiformis]|uniref:Uncharacterized protein n=1 Tax=Owenia fusiformis TaxID=6347 RepID=A0A8J1TPH2_OWEFU|nr:unnamed protein product [Owenia fusiformis]
MAFQLKKLLNRFHQLSHVFLILIMLCEETRGSIHGKLRLRGEFIKGLSPDRKENVPNGDVDPQMRRIFKRNVGETTPTTCEVYASNPYITNEIAELVLDNQLIHYNLIFPDYKDNPLLENMRKNFQSNSMSRANGKHGMTLLNLDFNYPVLSLTLLTIGVIQKRVELQDRPIHCLWELTEAEKIDLMIELLLRDFSSNATDTTLHEMDYICHEVIRNNKQGAYFTYRCCKQDIVSGEIHCIDDLHLDDVWLYVIYVMLITLKIIVLLFGPLVVPAYVQSLSLEQVPYVVKLKEPLPKTMYILTGQEPNLKCENRLFYEDLKQFPKFQTVIQDMPTDEIIDVKFTEYHIDVDHKNLLIESKVPVGVFQSLYRSCCLCKIQQVSPFDECCTRSVCGCLEAQCPMFPKWINIFKLLGRFCIVLLVPFPFYMRIVLYYFTEKDEIVERMTALTQLGLKPRYEFNLMEYLSPTHPMLLIIYIFYLITASAFVMFASRKEEQTNTLKSIITASLYDMENVSYLEALAFLVRTLIWPFRTFGIFGCFIGIVFWPLTLPLVFIVIAFYCLPIVYLTYRMLVHMKNYIFRSNKPPKRRKIVDHIQRVRETTFIDTISQATETKITLSESDSCFMKVVDIIGGVLVIGCVYALTIMLAECMGMIVEMAVYTLMGIIVNASSVLKYMMLIILVLIYAQSCFQNVYKKYLSLNKALFADIKGRLKELQEVANLPSHLQENRAFKGQELSEQGEHELPDDIAKRQIPTWIINDLILFLDSEDMPRVPIKLFQEVCMIRLAGSPGPVYASLLVAACKLLSIIIFLLFVFVVIMTFGSIYRISSTNQTLATLAGGMVPFLFKHKIISSEAPCELNSVSFKNKVNEVIDNFKQIWPMNDFTFELFSDEEEPSEEDDKTDAPKENGKVNGKDDKNGKDKKEKELKRPIRKDNHVNILIDLRTTSFGRRTIRQPQNSNDGDLASIIYT